MSEAAGSGLKVGDPRVHSWIWGWREWRGGWGEVEFSLSEQHASVPKPSLSLQPAAIGLDNGSVEHLLPQPWRMKQHFALQLKLCCQG